MAAPLYELATKETDFEWMARRDEVFEQLKTATTSWVSQEKKGNGILTRTQLMWGPGCLVANAGQ